MTKPKKKSKPKAQIGVAANARAASSKTGLSVEQVKAAKDAGCSAFHQSGRIDCDALLEWVAAHPEVAELEGRVDKRLEEALRIRVDRKTREVRLAALQGKVLDRAKAEEGIRAGLSIMFSSLDRIFLSESPAQTKGMDELSIRNWNEKKINELRATLRERFATIGEEKKDE